MAAAQIPYLKSFGFFQTISDKNYDNLIILTIFGTQTSSLNIWASGTKSLFFTFFSMKTKL